MILTPNMIYDQILPNRKDAIVKFHGNCVYDGELWEIDSVSGDIDDLIDNGNVLGFYTFATSDNIKHSKHPLERYRINHKNHTICVKIEGQQEMVLPFRSGGYRFSDED